MEKGWDEAANDLLIQLCDALATDYGFMSPPPWKPLV